MKKERLETITDGILAIIATLMTMQITLTSLSNDSIQNFLFQISVYMISFISIGILWLNHHQMFKNIETVEHKTVWINFFLLFSTSLIPLVTGIVYRDFFNHRSHVFYGTVLGLTTFFYTLLEETIKKQSAQKHHNKFTGVNWWATILYFSAVPFSFISVFISSGIFILIPLFYFMLIRKLNKINGPLS